MEIREKSENLNNVELLKGSHINIHIQIDNRSEKKPQDQKTEANRKLDEPKNTF